MANQVRQTLMKRIALTVEDRDVVSGECSLVVVRDDPWMSRIAKHMLLLQARSVHYGLASAMHGSRVC